MTPASLHPALGTVRGILLAAGIALFALLVPNGENAAGPVFDSGSAFGIGLSIGLGIALQLLWWLAMRAARHYEQQQQLNGALTPVIALVLELLIDAITIGLFAHAILSNWRHAGAGL